MNAPGPVYADDDAGSDEQARADDTAERNHVQLPLREPAAQRRGAARLVGRQHDGTLTPTLAAALDSEARDHAANIQHSHPRPQPREAQRVPGVLVVEACLQQQSLNLDVGVTEHIGAG